MEIRCCLLFHVIDEGETTYPNREEKTRKKKKEKKISSSVLMIIIIDNVRKSFFFASLKVDSVSLVLFNDQFVSSVMISGLELSQ